MKDIELNSERIQFKKTNPKNQSQNIFPSKYMKEKYPQLNKVVPKNSILFKVQYKPDSSYKEYLHTTYNNKNIKKLQNIINSSPININSNQINNNQTNNNQTNNAEQKYYEIHTNNTLLNYLDENDFKNYSNQKNYEESLIQSSGFKPINNESSFQNFLIERNNLNNEFIINPLNSNEITKKEKRIIKNKITKDKDYVINEYLKFNNYSNNKKGRTHKIQKNNKLNIDEMNIKNNYENKYNINTSNNPKNYNNNLYLKYKNNVLDSNNNFEYGHQVMNSIENLNFNSYKTKNLTTNFNDNYSKESFQSHKIDTFLSPNNLANKLLENKNNNNIDSIEDTNKGLNIKLNYYRIRLFKEFIKHFKKFCKIRSKKFFSIFLKNFNNKYNNNNKNIYEYKNNTISNIESKKVIILPNNDISDDLLVNNSKTGRNMKKLYKKINTDNIKKYNLNNINYTNEISNILKDKNYIKSDPRIRKNNKIIFIKRNSNSKNTETNSISTLSPSIHFKNSTIINKNISFRTEENIKENELFRNTKELNEKMKQIQTRKNRSKFKSNNNFMFKSITTEKTIKSDIDSQLNKIRKYMRSIKKNKNYKKQNTEILEHNQANENNENNNKNKVINNINRISRKKNIIRINNMLNINKVNSDYNKNENLDKYNTDDKKHNNVIEKNNNISSEKIIINNNNENPINKVKNLVNNNRAFYDNKKTHIVLPNQNYFYYNKIKDNNKNIKNYKVYSVIIKNLSTSDGRINIYINYFFLIRKNKPLITKYDHLRIVNNFSINFIYNDNNNNDNNISNDNNINNDNKNNNINNDNNNDDNNISNDNNINNDNKNNNINNDNKNNLDNSNDNNNKNNNNDNNNNNKKMNQKKNGPKLRPKLSSIQEEESQNQLSNERKENTKTNTEIYEKKIKRKRKNNDKNTKNNVDQ